MKKLIGLAAFGLFAISTSAWADCGGNHGTVAQADQPTITVASGAATQTVGTETKTTKTGN